MDESSWQECSDPQAMLDFLGEASARKLRLFAAACCRRIWPMLGKGGRKAVVAAERYADGLIGADELESSRDRAWRDAQVPRKWWSLREDRTANANRAAWYAANEGDAAEDAARLAALSLAVSAIEAVGGERVGGLWTSGGEVRLQLRRKYGKSQREDERLWERRLTERSEDAWGAERRTQSELLRCLFSPFRPDTLDPTWLTVVVATLLEAAHDERTLPSGELDSPRLAVLSDALEDAGCTDADLLGHLRLPGPHVRGCWAIDRLLGRS